MYIPTNEMFLWHTESFYTLLQNYGKSLFWFFPNKYLKFLLVLDNSVDELLGKKEYFILYLISNMIFQTYCVGG